MNAIRAPRSQPLRPSGDGGARDKVDPARSCATWRRARTALLAVTVLACCASLALRSPAAGAAVRVSTPAPARVGGAAAASGASGSPEAGSSLEAAASRAGSTGRKVAMSLIGLAFAVAGTVLAFRRDFKEAAGVFAVGIVAVLLATPAGINLLQDTVNSLFGA